MNMNVSTPKHLTLALAAACTVLPATTLHAATGSPEALAGQVERLAAENARLNDRLAALESRLAAPALPPAPAGTGAAQVTEPESTSEGLKLHDHLTLGGAIEGDFLLTEGFDGDPGSEFNLDTVELRFDLRANDWVGGMVVIDYDGDEDDIGLDEVNITLGGRETLPFFLTGGKLYAPFGDFTTTMIQDPFTLTLGEIVDEGVVAGWSGHGLSLALFALDGVVETGDSRRVNGFGASLAWEREWDEGGLRFGGGWVSNLADADAIGDALPRSEEGDILLDRTVDGLNLHGGLHYGALALHTEYTTALDSFAADEIAWKGDGARPAAWASELAWTTALKGHETTLALGFQKTWEAVALELPEYRCSVSAAVALFAGTTLHLEYYADTDYDSADDGTGDDGYGLTTRLAYTF